MKELPRTEKPSDMLTHSPLKAELDKFMPTIGLYSFAICKGAVQVVRSLSQRHTVSKPWIAAVALSILPKSAEAGRANKTKDVDDDFVGLLL